MNPPGTNADLDLLIVGGGINGAGIARDAAGRGLRVGLCDAGDFGGATSSASTKLIHGGLRYLEHYAFRLVAESLAERRTLARIAAHLVRPLRFVLPHTPQLRPAWMIRAGLLLYDNLGRLHQRSGGAGLPRSARVDLADAVQGYGLPLRPGIRSAFAYSDLAVDDARLVIANLRSAADHGADIMPRTRLLGARRAGGLWQADLADTLTGTQRQIAARALINAAGPWVMDVIAASAGRQGSGVVLVKGSHLVVSRLYAGDQAYLLQNDDGRIVFLIPYRQRYTLIGTTEVRVGSIDADAGVSAAEIDYLLAAANRYLATPVRAEQIVHRFWGCRPLFDDGSADASAVTRDYRLEVDSDGGAPCITIFGGKLTTYRRLAETVIARLPKELQGSRGPWTREAALPGSVDFVSAAATQAALAERFPWLAPSTVGALIARHGSTAPAVIGDCRDAAGLGRHFADGLSAREVDYFVAREWARDPDDILWRRSKAGLEMSAAERAEFGEWFDRRHPLHRDRD